MQRPLAVPASSLSDGEADAEEKRPHVHTEHPNLQRSIHLPSDALL